MSERLSVAKVLDEAQRQLDEFDPQTSGAWPHAAAALIRQCLESTLDVFWARKAPGMLEATASDRWICLPAYLGERPQAFHVIGFALVLASIFAASRKPPATSG